MATLSIPSSQLTQTSDGGSDNVTLTWTYTPTGSNGGTNDVTLTTAVQRLDSGSCTTIGMFAGKNTSTGSVQFYSDSGGTQIISTPMAGWPFIIPQSGSNQTIYGKTLNGSTARIRIAFHEL